MAIYTAECSHAFHFPCIASHVRKQDAVVCPVCNILWKDVPLLSIHNQIRQQGEKIPANNTPVSSPKYTNHGYLKSYADDEPLVSPKFDHLFKGSTQSEAAELQEVEEFQGFFVNPISSSDNTFSSNRESRNVEVCLWPEAAVICLGRTHETYVVVLKIKAPPPPPLSTAFPQRAPIDLVTVLNVSDSMSGTKLQMLKRTMHLVISSLCPADRLSVVAFAATPKRLMPLIRMTAQGQHSARLIVDCLRCCHGSSMAEALNQATILLQDRRERNPVASVILLSDGQDGMIPIENDTTHRHGSSIVSSTRFAHIELPINSSHKATGMSHEPAAEEAFSKCVGGLLSVVVHDLKIQLAFATGSDPTEILGVYSGNGHPTLLDSSSVKLGNLYAEEERQLYIELRVPHSNLRPPHCVLAVSCSHKDPATQKVIYVRDHALLVPKPQDVVRSRVLPKVEHLRYSFISSRVLAESRRLIEYDELCSAMQLLSSARALLLQSRSESALELVRGLEVELAEVHCRQYHATYRARGQRM